MNYEVGKCLKVIDSDNIAGNPIVYCKDISHPCNMVGSTYECISSRIKITLEREGTRGRNNIHAYVYTGDEVPPSREFCFREIK